MYQSFTADFWSFYIIDCWLHTVVGVVWRGTGPVCKKFWAFSGFGKRFWLGEEKKHANETVNKCKIYPIFIKWEDCENMKMQIYDIIYNNYDVQNNLLDSHDQVCRRPYMHICLQRMIQICRHCKWNMCSNEWCFRHLARVTGVTQKVAVQWCLKAHFDIPNICIITMQSEECSLVINSNSSQWLNNNISCSVLSLILSHWPSTRSSTLSPELKLV